MRILAALLLAATLTMAQAAIIGPAACPLSASPGQPVTCSVPIALSGGTVAFVMTAKLSLAATAVTMAPGAASSAAGKQFSCTPYTQAAGLTCIGFALNTTPILDGPVALLTFTPSIAGAMTVSLSGTAGASATALPIVITAGPSATLTIQNRCDPTGDGKTDGADLNALVTAWQAIPQNLAIGDLDRDGVIGPTDFVIVAIAAVPVTGVCLAKP